MSDFVWVGPLAGLWGDAANWDDLSNGTDPSTIVPGAADNVTFNGGALAADVIGGAGAANQLTFNGANAIDGLISTATLAGNGDLDIVSRGTLAAGSAALANSVDISGTGAEFTIAGNFDWGFGTVTVANGGALKVDGTITDGANVTGLDAADGGSISTAAIALHGNSAMAFYVTASGSGNVKLGSGTAPAGELFIGADAAFTQITGSSYIKINTEDDGTIAVARGLMEAPLISGSGALELTLGAALIGQTLSGLSNLSVSGAGAYVSVNAISGISNISAGAGAAIYTGNLDAGSAATGITLSNGSNLFVTGSLGAGTNLTMAGEGNILSLSNAGADDAGMLTGFNGSDAILVADAAITGTSFVSSGAGGLLNLYGSSGLMGALTLTGTYAPDGFLPIPLSGEKTEIVLEAVPCFCPGTRIATPYGETPVEALRIGDAVRTASGIAYVKWLGRRGYEGRFLSGNPLALPVTIHAGALDENLPARDLILSPGHALFIDGALIPAWRLINGMSITQARAVEWVEYLHVELEGHDIIFAESCPAESFLAENGREQFHNAAEFSYLYPNAAPAWRLMRRTEYGFGLEAIRARIAARAGLRLPTGAGTVHGFIDVTGPKICTGWAQFCAAPEAPVALDILSTGRRVARVLANAYRADLRQAGLGSGCHAFAAALLEGATDIEIRVAATGQALAPTKDARAA